MGAAGPIRLCADGACAHTRQMPAGWKKLVFRGRMLNGHLASQSRSSGDTYLYQRLFSLPAKVGGCNGWRGLKASAGRK